MSTIKISQLGNVSAFTDETIIPVVANVAGTLTTLKTDGDTLKTFVLGTVETDIANVAADVSTLQGNIVTLTANAAAQSGLIDDIASGVATFGNLIPSANVTYNLGSEAAQWKDLYLSGSTIYIGGATLSVIGGEVQSSLPIAADITATNLTVGSTRISFGSGGYIEETEVFDEFAEPLGYYGLSLNSSDDGVISMNALDSNASVTSSVFVTNVAVQLNVANSTLGESALIWYFDQSGAITFPDNTIQNTAYTGDYNALTNTPALGNVALSDDYNDLINTPALGNVALSDDYNDLINTPELATVATSGDFSDLTNLPVLGNVAFTSDYNDLINTPNLAAISEAVLAELETTITDGNITYGNLIPVANVTYNLGSESAQWKDLYLSGSTIYLGGTAISIVEGNLSVGGVEVSDGADGASAYEIAVANGYSDNEVAWLASLVGPAGADGIDGLDGATGSLSALTTVAKTGGDQITPTAIDLTKNVNKLTSGRYTLADGAEGQLMYIVPQHASGAVNMIIEVANADLGMGANTDQELAFKGDGTSQVITLIFTDGAWSQSGGEWFF